MKTYSVIILFADKLCEVVAMPRGLAVKLHPHFSVCCNNVEHRLLKFFSFHFNCSFCRIIQLRFNGTLPVPAA